MHASGRRRLDVFRLRGSSTVFGLFFLLPIWRMLRFSEGRPARHLVGGRLASDRLLSEHWHSSPAVIEITLELAVITCAVMLVRPTILGPAARAVAVAHLLHAARRFPAIVLVVGLGEIYVKIQRFSLSALMPSFWVYVIRRCHAGALAAGLTAIDVTTLSEAARSLGRAGSP